ncbi:MAG: histidinol-phosphate transaminase [Chitinophagaceae bacterium]|nr:histidinol-phosphate transaminase [Chitinophagaceae bacterium]
MKFELDKLVRENIKKMTPYSSARHEYAGEAAIFLDANENSFGSPLQQNYNRYPDPLQQKLKEKISNIKGVPIQNIFLGNGSDEAIDLLFRVFCEPGKDNAIVCPPTYGMYEVCAELNDVQAIKVPLLQSFQLDLDTIEKVIDSNTKLIFVCSPNNPTGNSVSKSDIEVLLNNFDGLVVIDEAYINFARQKTFIPELTEYPNLVILQTLSKAWGLAGLRIGMAFAGQPVIDYLNKVKYPYNISTATQQLAIEALSNISSVNNWTKTTVEQREWMSKQLVTLAFVKNTYPSDANFILVKMQDAKKVYDYLTRKGIIVRDRSNVILCDECLRITIGTPDENNQLVDALKTYSV